MKIIIIGCGKVGLTLAELLSAEKHDVVLIDESSQKLSSIPEELDALRILGNGASVNIQQEAGVEEADLLIAVTGSDELNLLCCLIAKKAGNCHTIARVRNRIHQGKARHLHDYQSRADRCNGNFPSAAFSLRDQDRHLCKRTRGAVKIPHQTGVSLK